VSNADVALRFAKQAALRFQTKYRRGFGPRAVPVRMSPAETRVSVDFAHEAAVVRLDRRDHRPIGLGYRGISAIASPCSKPASRKRWLRRLLDAQRIKAGLGDAHRVQEFADLELQAVAV